MEDWYHDESRRAGPATRQEIEREGRRVGPNLSRLLDLFAETDSRATLFFLAEVAEEYPELVRRAQSEGHEIACHGLRHLPVHLRTANEVRADLREARARIEQVTGGPIRGFRAPLFVQRRQDLWLLDLLAELGFEYDSSFLPIRPWPGKPESLSPRGGPIRLANGLWEFPLPLSKVPSGHYLPCAAGGFILRTLPLFVTRYYLAEFNREHGPAILYTHPWEIDPGSGKLPGTPAYVRFFNGVGRRSLLDKLQRLLGEIDAQPICEIFAKQLCGGVA